MHLVKGYCVVDVPQEEERFRYPAIEEVTEVSCDDDEDDQPVASDRRATGRSMRVRSLDRGRDLGFAYQS
jgi:hypothetical protein